jgi:tetratricopeptide (TPR) repeat protein
MAQTGRNFFYHLSLTVFLTNETKQVRLFLSHLSSGRNFFLSFKKVFKWFCFVNLSISLLFSSQRISAQENKEKQSYYLRRREIIKEALEELEKKRKESDYQVLKEKEVKELVTKLKEMLQRKEEENKVLQEKIKKLNLILSQRDKEMQELNEFLNSMFSNALKKEKKVKKEVAAEEETKDFLNQEIFVLKSTLSKKEVEIDRLREELMLFKKNMREEKADLYEKLGTAYIKSKLYQEAINAYNQSLKYNPHNPKVYYYLALLYQYAEHNSGKATEFLKKYVEMAPQGEYAKKAEKLIEILSSETK